MINAESFWRAFSEEWQIQSSAPEFLKEFEPVYEDSKRLNPWFLDESTGFLAALLPRLGSGLSMLLERLTIDAAIVEGDPPLGKLDDRSPKHVHALIEHEVSAWPDEEIWKLALFNCPLKVVVFYDFESDTAENDPRIDEYLDSAEQYLRGVPLSNELLVILGKRDGRGAPVSWQAQVFCGSESSLTRRKLGDC